MNATTSKIYSILFWLFICSSGYAQAAFSNCSAAFLDNKMIVDTYSPFGACILDQTSKGTLTVCTAALSDTENKAVDKIKFKIALRDQLTKTLTMYSDETFTQISIQKIMSKVQPGDHVVLITMQSEYSLPHNEILVR
ncbi:MAG: hypothetical protein WAT88_05575 [Saprospiraceae bacterium]